MTRDKRKEMMILADMIKETGNAPITVAELIRCKDCYWYIESDVFKSKDCTHFSGLKTPNPDDYCSYAERRDDETD